MKKLPFAADSLRRIATELPTPFYLYDEQAIRSNARRLQAAFAWNRGYREFFSVKTTPNPAILRIFNEEGCGADCASKTELLLAASCGFSGEDIMFTSNNTPADEYQLAKRLGAVINLDDIEQRDYLRRAAGLPALISCRYNPGFELRHDGKLLLDYTRSKHGSTREQILAGFRALRQDGVSRFGIHAQFGCHRRDAAHFGASSRFLFQLAVDLLQETDIRVEFINFAGGLGISYRPDDAAADLAAVSAALKTSYDEIIGNSPLDPLPLYSELGIFMTGPYGYFVTSVLHLKTTYKQFAGLDASTNAFMSPLRYNDYHHVSVLGKEDTPHDCCYDLTGALCEDRDRFAVDRALPRLAVGDRLVFHDAGAYSYCHATNFNGKLRPAEYLLTASGELQLIRRAETPADYFATLAVPDSAFCPAD